ncbi:uncharacterized protein LOC119671918 [Teleopsis dalmanni]|uniref:uncharacterized protein LOC119671918 n=1 Tax=Teleopsis dalmanni TaxID=139649 RepID=UPI0018CE7C9B|nr:uncharacterized protein LOC119671918 [Teleopsis dalmanni]XP_037938725.1 uncharacterized protein LOC119671918 [Teleopsis dalmanni]
MGKHNNTNLNNGRIYQPTTVPIIAQKKAFIFSHKSATETPVTETKEKKPRHDKSDLGEHFIAPDGGWAWLVCVAAGISNLSIYPCVLQFGLIFRDQMGVLGLTSSQVTTIINTNPAISACSGLLNGPMFRRFSFRQVALIGALFIFVGIILIGFSETFMGYMFSYALLFGFGMGISVSASSLAINTYFQHKRRKACGFSWTLTGLGPIVLPYIVTLLLSNYGVQGTVFIFAAFSLHAVVCALIYQPVRYHTKKQEIKTSCNEALSEDAEIRCNFCNLQEMKETGIFSSQYLYQDDDVDNPGYEIIEPGTPMLSRANDGWFGSKLSLTSGRPRFKTISSSKDLETTNRYKEVISEEEQELDEFFKPNNFNREREEVFKRTNSVNRRPLFSQISKPDVESCELRCTCHEMRALTQIQAELQSQSTQSRKVSLADQCKSGDTAVKDYTFLQKVVAFFDLNLLRDFTYVNLVLGLTFINFGELNFSILTPFILSDFGFTTSQITLAMSVLAGVDITMRFLVPFLTEKIPWDNRVFFLIGVVGIALGRTVVAATRSFTMLLACFSWLGIFKGIRTIFWPLIIPSYVPLNRLPAASGLQLLISGIFTLAAGPFVGLIRDRFNYSVALHCLDLMTFIAATSWTVEALVRRYLRKRKRKHVRTADES